MNAGSRKLLLSFIGLGLLAYAVYRASGLVPTDFSGQRLLSSIREARVSLLLLSLMGVYICYALRALRWQRFSRYLGPTHFWGTYRMTLAGFASLFLLGRAGEPVRPLLIARKERLPMSGMFGIYFLERFFDTACTAAIAVLALATFSPDTEAPTFARTTSLVLLFGLAVAVGFLVYFRLHGAAFLDRRLHGWRVRGGGWAKFAGIITGFSHGLQAIRTLGDLTMAVVYSAAHWGLVALIYFWVAQSFGGRLATIGFAGAMLVLAITMLGSIVQLPVAGGGAQLAAIVAYTGIFGVESEPATAAAMVLWLVTFAACSVAGVPLLIHEGWSIGELRRTAEREESAAEEA